MLAFMMGAQIEKDVDTVRLKGRLVRMQYFVYRLYCICPAPHYRWNILLKLSLIKSS